MKLSDLGEFGLINRIRKLSRTNTSALVGIGDDAAALKLSASHVMLVTTDLLLENVHFDLSYTDYYSLGWKSAAVNLSDIAAMGGFPRSCLTALGIPRGISSGQVFEFYRGFNHLLRTFKATLIGGDTCSSGGGLFISVTAIGEVKQSQIITRAGARPGDRIFITGTLGDSAAGLELLQGNTKTKRRNVKPEIARLVEKHLRPVPRVDWGAKLAHARCASALIDVSDGLSSDLLHICEQSRVGADIVADRIPVSPALEKMSSKLSKPPLHYALAGGEDYELLFTVPPGRVGKLHSLNLPLTEIGTITARRTSRLVGSDGSSRRLLSAGYDHFRKDAIRPGKR